MDLADAPAAAVAGEDALGVQMLDNRLDAHVAAVALTVQSEPVDQTDRVGVQWVDFQLLLGLGPTLFGGGNPVASAQRIDGEIVFSATVPNGPKHHVLKAKSRLVYPAVLRYRSR